ncbi:MAG TPA: DNA alkylation repair protein [Acidimicrobiales bacterium]|nr:DNA alkylation repair protein [Acidimicrobiales bacterium]
MTTPAPLTGAEVADRIAAALGRRADADWAGPMARYMRDQFAFLGVMAPAQKDAWREVAADLPRDLPEPVVVEAATALWDRPEREHQYLACTLVNRHATVPARAPGATPAFLDTVEALLTTKPWWDTVDSLASHAVGALVARHRELRPRMDAWLAGDDLWLVRSALLHMLGWKAATDAGWLFAACLARADHPDFFVRKAIGWALREYSKVDEHAVVAFVADHEGELSSLSRREALMWLERRRRRLAAAGG